MNCCITVLPKNVCGGNSVTSFMILNRNHGHHQKHVFFNVRPPGRELLFTLSIKTMETHRTCVYKSKNYRRQDFVCRTGDGD